MKTGMKFLAIGCLLLLSGLAVGMSSSVDPLAQYKYLMQFKYGMTPVYRVIANAISNNDFTQVKKLVEALENPAEQLNNGSAFGVSLLSLAYDTGNKVMIDFLRAYGATLGTPDLPMPPGFSEESSSDDDEK